jgi:hypothetical protein
MLFRGYIRAKPVSLKVSCSADLDVKRQGRILKSFLFTSMGRCTFNLF